MERTEEQKIVQAPLLVVLGGKEYEVKPLVIRDSRKWRHGIVTILASLPQYLGASSDDPVAFGEALKAFLESKPDEVIDLFFSYAKDLNREEIEGAATDSELAAAFDKVVAYAFPLDQSLIRTMKHLAR